MKKINASLGILSFFLLIPTYILPSNTELVKQAEVKETLLKNTLEELLKNAEDVFLTEKKYHIHGPEGLLVEGTLTQLLKSLDASYLEEFTRRKSHLLSLQQTLNNIPQEERTFEWEQAQCVALFLLAQPISERKTELAPAITNTIEYKLNRLLEKLDSLITFAEKFMTKHKPEITQLFAEQELKNTQGCAENKALWLSLEQEFLLTPQEHRTFEWKEPLAVNLWKIDQFFSSLKTDLKLNLTSLTNQLDSLDELARNFISRHKAEFNQTFLGGIFNLKMNQQKASANHLETSTVEEASTSVEHRRGKDINSGEQSNCGVM